MNTLKFIFLVVSLMSLKLPVYAQEEEVVEENLRQIIQSFKDSGELIRFLNANPSLDDLSCKSLMYRVSEEILFDLQFWKLRCTDEQAAEVALMHLESVIYPSMEDEEGESYLFDNVNSKYPYLMPLIEKHPNYLVALGDTLCSAASNIYDTVIDGTPYEENYLKPIRGALSFLKGLELEDLPCKTPTYSKGENVSSLKDLVQFLEKDLKEGMCKNTQTEQLTSVYSLASSFEGNIENSSLWICSPEAIKNYKKSFLSQHKSTPEHYFSPIRKSSDYENIYSASLRHLSQEGQFQIEYDDLKSCNIGDLLNLISSQVRNYSGRKLSEDVKLETTFNENACRCNLSYIINPSMRKLLPQHDLESLEVKLLEIQSTSK